MYIRYPPLLSLAPLKCLLQPDSSIKIMNALADDTILLTYGTYSHLEIHRILMLRAEAGYGWSHNQSWNLLEASLSRVLPNTA